MSTLEVGRRKARRRMVDTFEISVPTGGTHYDEATGLDVEDTEPLFTTPGYIPPATTSTLSSEAEVGGRTAITARREIRIPWDAAQVPPGAVAVCTAIGRDTPPRMLNRRYRVGGSDGASQGTACHLEIEETIA